MQYNLVFKARPGRVQWSGVEGAYLNITVVWSSWCVSGHESDFCVEGGYRDIAGVEDMRTHRNIGATFF